MSNVPVPVKVLCFNDLHIADKPPLNRKAGYREEGLAMLDECVDLAIKHDAVLATTGDLYHKKSPRDNSHSLNGDIGDILKRLNKPFLLVPGNHDMGPAGINSLFTTQAMRELIMAGQVKVLDGNREWYGNLLIVSRPYNIHTNTNPDWYKLTESEYDARISHKAAASVLMLAHGDIIPDHEYRPYPTVRISQIDSKGIDVLCSGHIHEDLGVWPLRPNQPDHGLFVNVGALGRASNTVANKTRQVQVVLITHTEAALTVDRIPLKSALPGDSIFHEDVLDTDTGDSAELREFVKDLTKGGVIERLDDVRGVLDQLDVKAEVKQEVIRLLEEAGL